MLKPEEAVQPLSAAEPVPEPEPPTMLGVIFAEAAPAAPAGNATSTVPSDVPSLSCAGE